MEINRPKRRKVYPTLLLGSIIIGLLVVAMGPIVQAFAEESVSVSCYNLQSSSYSLGNVVVFDTSQAAGACNQVYYACKGRCVGCFADSDYIDSVCVDVNGTMFLK
jgi:hypothetical protein